MVGMSWLACRSLWNLRPIRSGQDKWLTFLMLGLLVHFFLLFVFPIIRIPNKLFQVPWPWMAMFHAMVALAWLTDIRRCIQKEDVRFIVQVMAWLGAGLSIYMVAQAHGFDPLIWLIRRKFSGFKWLGENHVIGLMGNSFQASAALTCLIPAIAYFAFKDKASKAWKLMLAVSLYASVLAASVVGTFASVLGLVIASRKVQTWKAWAVLGVLMVVLTAGLAALKPTLFLDGGRLEIWRQAAHHIIRHPILGVGLNQFKLLNIQHTPNIAYDVRWAHNEWVHFSTEVGVIWTFCLGVYLIRESIKLSRIHQGMFGCFISVIVLSFFHIPFHLAPVLVIAGMCLSTSHLNPEKEFNRG